MAGKECYHCRELIEDKQAHDCWTTTEEKLTQDLPEPLLEAWERLREAATDFGEQRIYASHKSIMFARKTCYFFVRPKKAALEVCFFLDHELKKPFIRKRNRVSKTKIAHLMKITHRDEVEAPVTDWLREAYQLVDKSGIAIKKKSKNKKSNAKSKRKS